MMYRKNMEKLTSFVGAQSEFQGDLISKGILRIDGFATGRLQADQVILGETAIVKGEIIAKKIIVGGKVEGSLRAQDLVEITSKGKVKGEIFTCRLSLKEGGEFNGPINMKADDPKVLGFEFRCESYSQVGSSWPPVHSILT